MERTGRIRPFPEGKGVPKPFGIWYCRAVQKIGKLDIFRKEESPNSGFMQELKLSTIVHPVTDSY